MRGKETVVKRQCGLAQIFVAVGAKLGGGVCFAAGAKDTVPGQRITQFITFAIFWDDKPVDGRETRPPDHTWTVAGCNHRNI